MTNSENVIRETGDEILEKVVLDPVGVTQQYLDNVNLKNNVHVLRLDPIESKTNVYDVNNTDLSSSVFQTGVKDLEDLFYNDVLLFDISDTNPSLKNKFLRLDNWTYTRRVVQNCDSVTVVRSPFHLIDSLKSIYNEYNNGWDNISVKDKLNLTKNLSKLRYITDFRNLCGEELVGLNLEEFKNVAFVQSCNLFKITSATGLDSSLNRAPRGHFVAPVVNSLDEGVMTLPNFPVHTSATALLMAEVRSPNMNLPNVEIHFPLKFDTSVVKYNVVNTYDENNTKLEDLLEGKKVEDLPKVDSPVVIVNDFAESMISSDNYTIKSADVFGKITGFQSSNDNTEISAFDTKSLEVSVYTVCIDQNEDGELRAQFNNKNVLTATQIKNNSNVEMFYCVQTTPPDTTNGKLFLGEGSLWRRLKINIQQAQSAAQQPPAEQESQS
jgi:hypothetical protein